MSELKHYGVKGMKWGKRRAARKAEVDKVFNKNKGKSATIQMVRPDDGGKKLFTETYKPSIRTQKIAAKRIVKGKNTDYDDAVNTIVNNRKKIRDVSIAVATVPVLLGTLELTSRILK